MSSLVWRTALRSPTVRCDIRFQANKSEYEANKTGFICLFRIEANRRILHAKRIKTEANIPSKQIFSKRTE